MPDLVIGLILTLLVIVLWWQAVRAILNKKPHKHAVHSGMFSSCHSDDYQEDDN